MKAALLCLLLKHSQHQTLQTHGRKAQFTHRNPVWSTYVFLKALNKHAKLTQFRTFLSLRRVWEAEKHLQGSERSALTAALRTRSIVICIAYITTKRAATVQILEVAYMCNGSGATWQRRVIRASPVSEKVGVGRHLERRPCTALCLTVSPQFSSPKSNPMMQPLLIKKQNKR